MEKLSIKLIIFALTLALLIISPSLMTSDQTTVVEEEAQQSASKEQLDIQVPPPPFSEDIFPCTECHADMEANLERRELEDFHDDILFEHDEKNRWCMDCHDANNRDMLHSASGELIDFQESYKLCGQCHGPKLRDWKAGIHGRRTGKWNGQKRYLLCAHCHDPHAPKYKKIKPEPPPERPGKIK
ncbi:MAG: cytochrome c3 family protein [Candidatus Aminicenantes bacterium]